MESTAPKETSSIDIIYEGYILYVSQLRRADDIVVTRAYIYEENTKREVCEPVIDSPNEGTQEEVLQRLKNWVDNKIAEKQ